MNIPGSFAKHFKCPCCSNPWNNADDNVQIKDNEQSTSVSIPCDPCLRDDKGYSGIDPDNFDNTVSPKDNFYLWSNGGWKNKNPIPPEYANWGTFICLRDMNLDRLKVILDDLGKSDASTVSDPEHVKLSDFFNSFMDEESIEKRGVDSLSEVLSLCLKAKANPTLAVANLHARFGVNPFFRVFSSPDKKNSEHTIAALYQGGLGLPDRDYYFDEDKADKRTKYLSYIQSLFELLGSFGSEYEAYADSTYSAYAAAEVMALETSIAASHLTRSASRDPELTYNKMSIPDLIKQSNQGLIKNISWSQYLARGTAALNANKTAFDWVSYFEILGKPVEVLGDINVAMLDAITKVSEYITSPSISHYLLFHTLHKFAPQLTVKFVDLHFNFTEKELKGTAEQQPRWKRALAALEDCLGDALGKLYVSRHFPGDSKALALDIVEQVRDALRERLNEVEWMSTSTKSEALLKMERFRVKIGFPDKWLDYTYLNIKKGFHLENILESHRYQISLELSRMNAPTDRDRWFMTPQTVNAYYHPSLNEIVFPAAILQPPFFDANADKAVQFGSLGAVIGHEMTHGFDDQGRKYDFEGNMRDWWTAADGEEYEKRTNVMIKQAEQFEVYGVKLKGKLTCGENIADLGGIKLSLRALKKHLISLPSSPELINGFTPEQRLFLAWSQAWRENAKKERALQLVTLDPHGPNELRCNGPLSNIQEFLEAFGIVEGDPMFRPESERVDIW